MEAETGPTGPTGETLRGKLAAIGLIVAVAVVCCGGLTALTSDSVFRALDTRIAASS